MYRGVMIYDELLARVGGGVETMIPLLTESLVANRIPVTFATCENPKHPVCMRVRAAGGKIVSPIVTRGHRWKIPQTILKFLLVREFRSKSYGLLHCINLRWLGNQIFRVAKRHGLATLYTEAGDLKSSLDFNFIPVWFPDILKDVDHLSVQGAGIASDYRKRFGFMGPISILPFITFVPAAPKVKTDSSYWDGICQLTFAGRLAGQKRLDRLIESFAIAAEQDTSIRLNIWGHGPCVNQMSLIEKMGIQEKAVYRGKYDNRSLEDTERVFGVTDILYLASDYEALPLVFIEAMSRGIFCIGPAVGGIPEMLGNGRGIAVAENSPSAYAAAILNAAELHRKRSINREVIIDYYKHNLDPAVITPKWVELHKSLLHKIK